MFWDLNNTIYSFYIFSLRICHLPIMSSLLGLMAPGAIDPTIKNLHWGDLVRGLLEAEDRDAHYPFLTDGDPNLTEVRGLISS